ncbi:MAG: bifunctional oligoribonuclease/PAP phosphatase NrnA [Patescibacteria group bacterium]|nr:bifunctional oligoribonuclease/PAP phosphatase NrnA [Patescibacteria group bacterium]
MVQKAQRILIAPHIKPDGDALGSALGLKLVLNKLGCQVEVVCLDAAPDQFSFLPQFYNIKADFKPQDFDMVILIDCGDWTRTGFFEDTELNIDWPNELAVIDHHHIQKLTSGLHIIDDKASSASELVYRIIKEWGIELNYEIATCLLTGLITDTGSFQHTNTTSEVLNIAGDLMGYGANLNKITKYVFADKALNRLRFWGKILAGLEYNEEWDIVVGMVDSHDFEAFRTAPADLEGLIDFLRMVPEASAVALVSEREEGKYKISFRTEQPNVDVSRLAKLFGGGGHVKAASAYLPKF